MYQATWTLIVAIAVAACSTSAGADPKSAIADALAKQDAAAIHAAVELGRRALGERAGDPESPDEYVSVPTEAKRFTVEEARPGMMPQFARLEKMRWWKIGVDPTTLTAPLRVPGAVVGGMVAVAQAKLDGAEKALEFAKDAADFLIWAQEQAGAGCYPFPGATRTSESRAMQVATRFLERAGKEGKLAQTVRNGWIYEDHGDGGLQFDNGECGVALFELYELTNDHRYLESARKAADWAIARPLCTNWNYNGFSVHLLAKAYAVTKQAKYRDAALEKALLGVIPGQLADGPRAGRWIDPHNARPAYHYIMMSALAQLAAVLPADHPERAMVMRSLALGLKTRNAEMVTRGVMNKDKAMESLILVHSLFADQPAFLTDTDSTQALNALIRLCSEQARRGKLPLGPRGWGEMLAYLSSTPLE